MARMFPPEVSGHTGSNAEKRLFGKFRAELGNEWTVLHSVGVAHHNRKLWAEIDFVLVGPSGIYCLEVKGGRVARESGRWVFTSGTGQRAEREQGPFEQVGSATAALRSYLRKQLPSMRPPIRFGVMTPDITFNVTGPDVMSEIVYDERDVAHGLEHYVVRLNDFWLGRDDAQQRRTQGDLLPIDIERVVETLRGDFDLRPSLRARLGMVDEELLRLTQQQYRVLDGLADNPRVIVRGGAGTGKTMLAVEEAIRAAQLGRSVYLFCFNRMLGEHLSEVRRTPGIEAWSLHRFLKNVVDRAGHQSRLPEASTEDLLTLFYPELAVEALIDLDLAETAEILIVDEAQDLLQASYLDFFDTLVKGGLSNGAWRVFCDPNQNIFDHVGNDGLKRLLEAGPAQYQLMVNCRNSEPVAVATSLLSGVEANATLEAEGPAVEYVWYRDVHDQERRVSKSINRLLGGGVGPDQITILSRYRLEKSCLASGLKSVPFSLHDLTEKDSQVGKAIRFSTIGAFKGMESEVVLLVDVDNLDDEASLRSIYVGASRARGYLGVFLEEAVRPAYEARAEEFGRQMIEVGSIEAEA